MKNISITEFSKEEFEEFQSQIFIKVFKEISKTSANCEEEYLTRHETANLLRISLPTLRKWTVDSRLTSYRIGSSIRYKKSEVLDSLKEVPGMKHRMN